MQIIVRLLFVTLCLSGLSALHAQAVLENFSSMRQSGSGVNLWSAYQGEDPGQVFSIVSGTFQDKGSTSTGCSYTGCGLYPQFMPGGSGYGYPQGYALNYLRSGTWDPNYNRLAFQFKCDTAVGRQGTAGNVQIGTYIRYHGSSDPNWQGDHYYHFIDPNVYPGQWINVIINRVPQHEVGASDGSYTYPDDPDYTGANPVHYFDGLTRFYFDTQPVGSKGWSGATCQFANFTFAKAVNEPESYVSSVTAQYNGSAYEVTWAAPRMVTGGQLYSVRYSTSDMHVNGFTSGTDGGTVRGPDGSAYVSTIWKSAAMAQAPTMYIAIQPSGQSTFTQVVVSTSGTAPPPPTTSACDVNGDSAVNSADVTLAIKAALGTASCAKDLDANGVCNVVDVQRVVNASLGAPCRTGQ